MKILEKPLGYYFTQAKTGVQLLILASIIRFTMKPLFQIPYDQGTHFVSVTILLLILMAWYSLRARGTYRDLLGIAAVLSLTAEGLIILSIAIDDLGGIDTYYTDPLHGGSLNLLAHMGGHLVGALIFTLFLWGLGSLILRVRGGATAVAGGIG